MKVMVSRPLMTFLAENAASALAWSRTKDLEPTWNDFCMAGGRLAFRKRERGKVAHSRFWERESGWAIESCWKLLTRC